MRRPLVPFPLPSDHILLPGREYDGSTATTNPGDLLRKIITTFFACLGLAGLSDNIVEWQDWFQHGVLAHWIAFKAAITGVLPFPIPDFLLDYLAIGALHVQSSMMMVKDWSTALRPSDEFRSQNWIRLVFATVIAVVVFAAITLAQMLIWPWRMFLILLFATDPLAPAETRKAYQQLLWNFAYLLIAFIPFLFVCSNLLEVLQAP